MLTVIDQFESEVARWLAAFECKKYFVFFRLLKQLYVDHFPIKKPTP